MLNESCIAPTIGAANSTFASALQFFAAATCLVKTTDWPPDGQLRDGEKFDFIIVGAGSAGCVLANRLSEVRNWKVLLLEAGENPPIESDIPYLYTTMFETQYDWQYTTINNGRTQQAYKNGRVNWPRGKMLGGSSSINAMVYVEGNPHDYQDWFNRGNLEWHPDTVRSYFKKSQSLQDPRLLKDFRVRNHYGRHGPLIVNDCSCSSNISIANKMFSAWRDIGVNNVIDLNTANNMGVGALAATISQGKRVSTAKAYLNPIAKERNNLKIGKKSFVSKILIDQNLKVLGVEVERNGAKFTFYASKEVILSAGSINTPQLLMLSGIGPKEHLEAKNIKTLVNSPMVGQNLHDHIYTPITIFADEPEEKISTRQFEVFKYLYKGKGFLSCHIYNMPCAFYAADKQQSYPNYQVGLILHGKNADTIESFTSLYVKSVEDSILKQSINKALFQFIHIDLHPYSRGNISLYSNNPHDHPLIYYDFFSDSRDLKNTVNGIKFMTRIVETKCFKSIGAFLGRIKISACDSFKFKSDEYWECIALNMATTLEHPVGTAKMGSNISESVVSSRLKVHGVEGVRVVDASVMPTIISGNPNGPIVMMAERVGDLIKEDYDVLN